MATIKKRIIGTKEYYYLQHTIRGTRGITTKEKYLGSKLPADIEKLKAQFLSEIYQERWLPICEKIRQNYTKDRKNTPKSALEKQIRSFSVRYTYDTNRIEGSKLTFRETSDLLERGLAPKSKPLADIKEAESHEKVFYEMLEFKKDISLQAILLWHKKLFENTKKDIAGMIRKHQVAISGSRFMPPSPIEVEVLLREFFRWHAKSKTKLHPIELAALVHLKFVTIHPFADGNGRISRLLMNFILHKHGYPLLNIPYEKRSGYYRALERAQLKNMDAVFVQWFIKRYIKENKAYAK